VVKKRGSSPLVLVDISNPRNIDPGVGRIENVFLYDLDALEGIAEQNRARRAKEIPKVERMVEEEVDQFVGWYDSLQVVPVIRALRDQFHGVSEQELEKYARRLSEADRETFRAFARSLVNKLLHQPTSRIRNIDASSHRGVHKLVAVQELFELELERYTDERPGRPDVDGGGGMSEALRIGTRGSALALWQAEHVAARIGVLPGRAAGGAGPHRDAGRPDPGRGPLAAAGEGVFHEGPGGRHHGWPGRPGGSQPEGCGDRHALGARPRRDPRA
jgi:hypothetical protein